MLLYISLCWVKDDKTWYFYDYTVTGESYANPKYVVPNAFDAFIRKYKT